MTTPTPTTPSEFDKHAKAFKAAVDGIDIPKPSTTIKGCGLCDCRVPTDPASLQAWSARELANELRWDSGPGTVTVLPATMFAICPPCEMMIIERDVAGFVDDELRRAVGLGLHPNAHLLFRSSIADFFGRFVNAIGEPRPLTEALG